MEEARCPTPSQTVGPFFHLGLDPLCNTQIGGGARGRGITIHGRVLDGAGDPVPDALLEMWHADASGSYGASPATERAGCFGRVATDDAGAFEIRTIMPGAASGPSGRPQAPHVLVAIFMRGLLRHLVTRIYFEDEPTNAADPILSLVEMARRGTLMATRDSTEGDSYTWDVHLQGPHETVFFEI